MPLKFFSSQKCMHLLQKSICSDEWKGVQSICNECSNHLLVAWRDIVTCVNRTQKDLEILLVIGSNVVILVRKQQMRLHVNSRDNSENRERWMSLTGIC